MTIKNYGQLNIAMIGQKSVPSRDGGIDVVVGELAPEMVKMGNVLTLFNRRRKYAKGTTLPKEYKGCSLVECYTINKRSLDALVYSYFATKKAIKMAKKGLLDVVHYHAEGPCFFLYKFPKKQKRKYRIVVTVHGIDSMRAKWKGLGSKVLKACENRIVKYADEIIVLSKNDHDYFMEKYGRETTIIPNGAMPAIFKQPNLIKEKWGLDKNQYLLSVTRIVPEKGLHYLIEAFLRVTEKTGSKVKLVLAGSFNHDKAYYDKIVNMCKDKENIVLTDFVCGEVLQELYSNALLYVLPSELEGMSMALIEAIAYQRPCLVSNIPENANVVGENGYLFESTSVESLTEKLEELLTAKEPLKVPCNNQMSWEEVASKTLEVYKGALDESSISE